MKYILIALGLLTVLTACDDLGMGGSQTQYPQRPELDRDAKRGKLTGEGLLVIGGSDDEESGTNSPISVNAFLWRATLDTLAFMPLTSADPFGGVILTDWYEDPNVRGERFKITVLILDRALRADSLKLSLFKQRYNQERGGWEDMEVADTLERKLEDTILTRARQLRVKGISD